MTLNLIHILLLAEDMEGLLHIVIHYTVKLVMAVQVVVHQVIKQIMILMMPELALMVKDIEEHMENNIIIVVEVEVLEKLVEVVQMMQVNDKEVVMD